MCGIIAFSSSNGLNVNDVIVRGLKRLEYRGYDSFGLAYLENKDIRVIKRIGKIGNFSLKPVNAKIAMGHTRWATHGMVTETNAHPHSSQNNKIFVVHNGIIENFQELKDFLLKRGYTFRSETDTEVIPQFVQFFMDSGKDFSEACSLTFNRLEGSFALILTNGYEIIGVRNGSPLVLGIDEKNNNYFFASDVPAFLEFTKRVIYIDDGEMIILKNSPSAKPEFFNYATGEPVKKQIVEINWSIEQAEKGNYEHFMIKEIDEQRFTIKTAIQQDINMIKAVTNEINNAFGIFFIGAGTSYHACVAASYLFSHIAKKHVNVILASEFPSYEEFLTDKTLVFAVSQSGETADLLEAVKSAKRKGAKVISIVNVIGSTLTRISDYSIMMNAGPEICVLSTKSYTSQLAIITLLAYSCIGKSEEGKELITRAAHSVAEIIDENKRNLKELASELKDVHDIFLIGRNSNYPTALEGALKIKEVSYIHAEGFAGGELKHGTIALIENRTPAIVISDEKTRKHIISNAMEIKARGGFIIGIDSQCNEVFDFFIRIPDTGNANPILAIIPIQMLSYYLAVLRNCDPDKPRNLAKSVTVN